MEASQVADVIIKRFIEKGKAKGSRNYFGYVDSYPNGIIVSRENGQDTKIPKTYLISAIEAVKNEPSIYNDGPTTLRPYINRRIYSPLWALLRLANLDELISEEKDNSTMSLPQTSNKLEYIKPSSSSAINNRKWWHYLFQKLKAIFGSGK